MIKMTKHSQFMQINQISKVGWDRFASHMKIDNPLWHTHREQPKEDTDNLWNLS